MRPSAIIAAALTLGVAIASTVALRRGLMRLAPTFGPDRRSIQTRDRRSVGTAVAPSERPGYHRHPFGSRTYRGGVGAAAKLVRRTDMSEQWSGSGSEQPYAQSEVTEPWGANGARPVTELADDQAAGDGSSNIVELADEAVAAALEDETTGDADADADVDDGSVFMAMLVRAMQTTASVERIRVAENTERRRQAVIDKVRARQATEANRMRELAGEDMRAIDAWAEQETKRIQHERERRAMEVNEDLQTSLAGHHRRIDREIEGIEAAVTTYLTDVEAFFASLDRESDLVAIAQQAGRRPVFPTLDAASETIGAGDSAESQIEEVPAGREDQTIEAGVAGEPESDRPLVGVMEQEASADPLQSWGAEPSTDSEGAPAQADEAVTEEAQASEEAEPVATGGSWSWRGGGGDGSDGSNRET